MARVRYWTLWLLFILQAFIIGVYTYCNSIDGVYVNVPVKFHYWFNSDVVTHKTTQDTYRRGDLVKARIIAKKPRVWPATLHWTLVDGDRHTYPCKPGLLEPGVNDRVVDIERIPLNANPGEHYFAGVTEFDLNFIRRKIYIRLQSNSFTVIE